MEVRSGADTTREGGWGGGKGRQLGAGTATGLRVDLTSHTQAVGQSAAGSVGCAVLSRRRVCVMCDVRLRVGRVACIISD